MRWHAVGAVVVASLVAGCAHPGVGGAAAASASSQAAPSPARFAEDRARCVERSPQPAPTVVIPPPTGQVSPPAGALEELRRLNEGLRRKYTPDQTFFRDRRPLAAKVAAANQACADEVIRNLTLMSGLNRYDADSVKQILGSAGLTDIAVRPGRSGSGRLIFAGWTGQACVFGEYGPDHITAGVGTVVTGGGCLPD
jgi:hypothetical protein